MQHGSKKLRMQGGMSKSLLEAISLDVTSLRVHTGIAEFRFRWDVVSERTSEHASDVDLE
jgi:hypothetical protein